MKIFTTLGIIAAFGLVYGCSSDGSSSGTGGAAGASTGGTSATGGSGGTGGMAGSSTGGSSTGGMAGSASGGSAGAGNDCLNCLQNNCATELGTCAANAECYAIITCAGNCSDQACVDQCYTDHPTGQTDFDAVDTCIGQKCSTECAI